MEEKPQESLEINDISEEVLPNTLESIEAETISNELGPVEEMGNITLVPNSVVEGIFGKIEEAFPKQTAIRKYALPLPTQWLGPRFMAIWVIPIFVIKQAKRILQSANPVKPYMETKFTVKNAETIYTSTKRSLHGGGPIRFFGPRFIAIWVLPIAITGTFMEILFVSPLRGVNPFG